MREVALKLLLMFSFLTMAGCQTGGEVTQADLDAAEAEVQAVMEDFWEAWGAASFDGGMAFYSDDPEMAFAGDGVLFESKAAVGEAYRAAFELLERQEITITDTRIHALTPEIVYAAQAATYAAVSRSGETSPTSPWAGSFLWVKEGGEWSILNYHGSDPKAPPAGLVSLHLLNGPSPDDEAAYAAGLRELNDAIRAAGYLGNGYELWKVAEDQESEYDPVGAGLILEGKWTDQEAYDLVHALEAYEAMDPEVMEMFQRVAEGQRYTRYVRVPVGGPGEG